MNWKGMIGMKSVHVERTIHVPCEAAWKTATDFHHAPIPSWNIEVIREGDAAHHEIGLERIIREGRREMWEKIVNVEPSHVFEYELTGGGLKEYHGRAQFIPKGESTEVRWTSTFETKIPGMGWIAKNVVIKNINHFIDGLAMPH